MSNVTVNQITSKRNISFLNVDEGLHYIYVWTSSFRRPTYLLQLKHQVGFVQFDDQDVADEWLEDHSGYKATLLTNEDN